MRLILATHNLDKRSELRSMLEASIGMHVELLTLEDIDSPVGDIEETGSTLEENALIKARTVFNLTGIPAVADDTGLEVEALSGAPGVYSARYSGEGATYASNIAKLLRELGDAENRHAKFSTVIAFCPNAEEEHLFRGEVDGIIAREPHGKNGFGYDPIFIPEGGSKSFAEMTADEKNTISHRGRAMQAFVRFLKAQLK